MIPSDTLRKHIGHSLRKVRSERTEKLNRFCRHILEIKEQIDESMSIINPDYYIESRARFLPDRRAHSPLLVFLDFEFYQGMLDGFSRQSQSTPAFLSRLAVPGDEQSAYLAGKELGDYVWLDPQAWFQGLKDGFSGSIPSPHRGFLSSYAPREIGGDTPYIAGFRWGEQTQQVKHSLITPELLNLLYKDSSADNPANRRMSLPQKIEKILVKLMSSGQSTPEHPSAPFVDRLYFGKWIESSLLAVISQKSEILNRYCKFHLKMAEPITVDLHQLSPNLLRYSDQTDLDKYAAARDVTQYQNLPIFSQLDFQQGVYDGFLSRSGNPKHPDDLQEYRNGIGIGKEIRKELESYSVYVESTGKILAQFTPRLQDFLVTANLQVKLQ